ncbi:MAG: hypothetical protein R3C99_03795 [Pirellulaceae bacterium]|nr:hypothetical protein [Planctomycetales bacterium]MCA9207180.1 hypothetical protein [Planctomycetales bacterium]
MATTIDEPKTSPISTAKSPKRGVKLFVSLLLAIHLLAVFVPPYRFATRGPRGTAPTAEGMFGLLKPYIDFTYLDHGYFFFAPNPGASHLMEVTVTPDNSDGDAKPITRRYPNRDQDWPRLLYHRHFMLSEWLNSGFAPSTPPADILQSPEELEQWQRQREVYALIRNSYERHLRHTYQSEQIQLDRIEHRPPELPEFRDLGWRLDDERLYSVMPEDRIPDEPALQGGRQPLPEIRIPLAPPTDSRQPLVEEIQP